MMNDEQGTMNRLKRLAMGLLCSAFIVLTSALASAQSPQITFYQTTAIYPYPVISTLAWGGTQLNVAATTQSFIVQNTGTATASTVVVAISTGNTGDFSLTTSPATNCGGSLTVNATCTVTVTFTPAATGSRSSEVLVSGSNFTSASLPITGIGISLVPPTPSANYTLGCTGALTSTGTDYLFMAGGTTSACSTNTSAATGFALTSGGYLENLFVTVNHVVTTGTDTYTVLDCSGASCTPTSTGITCTITGASALSCKDVTHSYLALAGDWITISVATSGASAATVPIASLEKH
jgi:hypothetical protein